METKEIVSKYAVQKMKKQGVASSKVLELMNSKAGWLTKNKLMKERNIKLNLKI